MQTTRREHQLVSPIDLDDRSELARYVDKIQRVYGIDDPTFGKSVSEVIGYYASSSLGYHLFHSSQGALHMALNPDGVFHESGYLEQAHFIHRYLLSETATVLELGSGKGFNTVCLAQSHASIDFTGIDLTPQHVATAQRRAAGLRNVHFHQANMEDLPFASGLFDLMFEVESMCHALDMKGTVQIGRSRG